MIMIRTHLGEFLMRFSMLTGWLKIWANQSEILFISLWKLLSVISTTSKLISCLGRFLTLLDPKWPQLNFYLSVNDLTVISEDEFYFTNDSGFSHQSHSMLRLLEMFVFPIVKAFGSVGYCNDGECKIVRFLSAKSNSWPL